MSLSWRLQRSSYLLVTSKFLFLKASIFEFVGSKNLLKLKSQYSLLSVRSSNLPPSFSILPHSSANADETTRLCSALSHGTGKCKNTLSTKFDPTSESKSLASVFISRTFSRAFALASLATCSMLGL